MSSLRQDFLLQPYTYEGSTNVIWDFPLDDFYVNGVIQPTPYGDSDDQHKLDILINSIGSIKQFPLLGFSLFQHLESEVQLDQIYSQLSEVMEMDLYKVGTGAVIPNQGESGNNNFSIDIKKITPAY